MQTKSPFPGMDPFMEHRHEWAGVYARLIVVLCDLIIAKLPANFSAKIRGGVKEVEMEAVTPRWIEIVDLKDRQMVTAIELLSPSNKGRGFHAFNQKRDLVVEAEGNWVEIDLLRKGKRPQPFLFDTDYYALMIRSGERHWRVWEMSLQQPLQTIGIPLSDGYNDVPLDLQKAIETVYTEGEYWRDLMYDERVPPPRLSADNQTYIDQKLAAWKTAQP